MGGAAASVRQALVGVSEGADPICVGTGAHMQTQLLNNFMLDIAANKRHSLNTREKAANFVQMLWQYKSKACHSPTHPLPAALRHCARAASVLAKGGVALRPSRSGVTHRTAHGM